MCPKSFGHSVYSKVVNSRVTSAHSGRRTAFLLGAAARPVRIETTRLDGGTWRLTAIAEGLSPVTSYLLVGDRGCLLMDPGSSLTWPEILGALARIDESIDIKWVAGHTALPSSVGALPLIQSTLGSDITVVTSPALAPQLAHYGLRLPVLTLADGGTLDIGGRRLSAEASGDSQSFALRDAMTGRLLELSEQPEEPTQLPDRLESARKALENVLLTTLAPIALEGRALAALAPIGRVISLRTYVRQDEIWWELGGKAGLLGSAINEPPPAGDLTLRIELTEPTPTVLDLRFAPQSQQVLADPALADLITSLEIPLSSAIRRVLTLREQVLMTRKLRSDLRRDPLTGVGNRRAMQNWAPTGNWSLLMVDLDGFAEINEIAGHNAGDRVLRTIADIISREVGEQDLVVRYGGDEFVVMLGAGNTEQAQAIAERVRQAVAAADSESLGVPRPLAVSIGVASGSGSPLSLLSSADQALRNAKSGGQNRVAVADPSQA